LFLSRIDLITWLGPRQTRLRQKSHVVRYPCVAARRSGTSTGERDWVLRFNPTSRRQ
jgi:hypothetical protein